MSHENDALQLVVQRCGLRYVAEYALLLAVLLVVVAGAVAAIGTNADTIFGREMLEVNA